MLFRYSIQIVIGLFCWATVGYAQHVQGMRVWTTADNTRVVFDLSSAVQYKMFTLDNPKRVVLDLQANEWKVPLQKKAWGHSGIRSVRHSLHTSHTLRVVLELEKSMKPTVFALTPDKQYGHRLVLDLKHEGKHVALSHVTKLKTRPFIVAIDAGHGGQDSGAVSRQKRLREKDIVLAVAQKLQGLINAKPGMRAYLVRDADYYVGLRKRMELARAQGADLFISIHADSFKDPRASGAAVFVLSEKGASNEAARWLAEKENRADWVGGVRLEDKPDILATVLLDLSQTASQTASDELASYLINQLARVTDLHHKTVQRAGFMVLKSPDIPSVLVELGFLSNSKGEAKLADRAHQQALAKALFTGVQTYLSKRPTPVVYPDNVNMARSS